VGEDAQLRLDSLDACDAVNEDNIEHTSTSKEIHMPKYKINGIEYEAAQEVINHATVLQERADSAVSGIKSMQVTIDKLTAERDSQKDRADSLEKRDIAKMVADGVKARRTVESAAVKILAKEAADKIDSMTDAEIQESVIKTVFPNADLKDKSADYVNARFDAAVDAAEVIRHDSVSAANRAASAGAQKQDAEDKGVSADGARQKMIAELENGWKKAE
jgi:hypothetical protein